MKKLCCLIVLALATLIAVSAVLSAPAQAAASAGHHLEFIELFFGTYEHEYHAHEKAEEMRDRGFHAEVFYRDHGWTVRAWKHE